MFTKIGKNLPNHHLLFYSFVLIVLSFMTIFNPYFSSKENTEAAPPDPQVNVVNPTTLGSFVTSNSSIFFSGNTQGFGATITHTRWTLNGGSLQNATPPANWNFTVNGLNYGRNDIFIQSTDTLSRVGTASVAVYRLPDNGDSLGFAYSSNFGWISFSSLSDGSTVPYGLNVDPDTGNLSGYAWSEYAGWISFGEEAPNYDFNSNCYTSTCISGSGCSACYHPKVGASPGIGGFYGWAKVLVLGDNGWIKLAKEDTDPGSNYGVKYDIPNREFFGYAWNGNSGIDEYTGLGWISFNCIDSGNDCAVSNYKVMANLNMPPEATINQSDPANELPCGAESACVTDCELNPVAKWNYYDPEGYDQYAYRVVVRTDTLDPESPGALRDTGKVISSSKEININEIPPIDYITYGTQYYIHIMVWDNFDLQAEDWLSHNFTTHNQKFPEPYFDWFVPNASAEEEILFWDRSTYYPNSAGTRDEDPGDPGDCLVPTCTYLWESTSDVDFNDNTLATTTATYKFDGNNQDMTLTVWDGDLYSCSTSTTLNINKRLPDWIEVR